MFSFGRPKMYLMESRSPVFGLDTSYEKNTQL